MSFKCGQNDQTIFMNANGSYNRCVDMEIYIRTTGKKGSCVIGIVDEKKSDFII
jgi:hypothetical protein